MTDMRIIKRCFAALISIALLVAMLPNLAIADNNDSEGADVNSGEYIEEQIGGDDKIDGEDSVDDIGDDEDDDANPTNETDAEAEDDAGTDGDSGEEPAGSSDGGSVEADDGDDEAGQAVGEADGEDTGGGQAAGGSDSENTGNGHAGDEDIEAGENKDEDDTDAEDSEPETVQPPAAQIGAMAAAPFSGGGDIIYVDAEDGDDADDGLTESTALATFGKAYELVENGGTIAVLSDLTLDETVELDEDKTVTIMSYNGEGVPSAGPGFYAIGTNGSFVDVTMLRVTAGHVIFKNITIDAIDAGEHNQNIVYVIGGEVTVDAGTKIINSVDSGVVVYGENSKLTLKTGGEISNNDSNGVVVYGQSEFVMEGGIISESSSSGVSVHDAALFTMRGGEIIGNINEGAQIAGGVSIQHGGEFIMDGGSVSGNEGGVQIYSDSLCTISGGEIKNNSYTGISFGAVDTENTSTLTITGGSSAINISDNGDGIGGNIGISSGQITLGATPPVQNSEIGVRLYYGVELPFTFATGTNASAWKNVFFSDNSYAIALNGNELQMVAEINAAQIGATKYETLAAAMTAAADGNTIKLLNDAEISEPLMIVGKTVTIDGGGHTIKASDNYVLTYGGKRKWGIISIEGADGKTVTMQNVTVNANAKTGVIYANSGTLVLEDATITGGREGDGSGVYITSRASFIMESGSITGNVATDDNNYLFYSSDLWIGANAIGDIKGGTITNAFVNANEYAQENKGQLSINGGSVANVYLEFEKGFGGDLEYNSGNVGKIFLSKLKGNGNAVTVANPATGAYRGGIIPISIDGRESEETLDSDYTNVSLNLDIALPASPAGVTYTYNWYKNTVASTTGGTPIAGADSSEFELPDGLLPGTYYYYCEVEVSVPVTAKPATTESVMSQIAAVTVSGPDITGIAVKTQPAKLAYKEGELLNLAGLVVTLTYDTDLTEDVAFADFGFKSIIASPANGTAMVAATHNGEPVTVSCNGIEATTSDLTVTVPVTGVTLNKTITSILTDGAETLIATVAPDNATNKNITWSSSNNTVATVSATGVVTGVAAGKATVTVTTGDGGKTASCTVNVIDDSKADIAAPVPGAKAVIDVGTETMDTIIAALPADVAAQAILGKDVTISLTVTDIGSSIPPGDKSAIEQMIGGNDTVAIVLNIDLVASAGGVTRNITELDDAIQIKIPIQNKNPNLIYTVISVHNGTAIEYKDLSPSGADYILIKVKNFSTFAVISTPKPVTPKPVTPSYTTGSSSGSGNTYRYYAPDYSTTVSTYWNEAQDANAMIKEAKDNGLDYAQSRSTLITGIRKSSLLDLAKAGLSYRHDTVADGEMQMRLYVDEPGKAKKDILVSGYTSGTAVDFVKSVFNKWYPGKKLAAVSFDGQGDFGMQVRLAAKVDLSGMDEDNLYFYAYDRQANKYTHFRPEYRIDSNGYLHFATRYAGDVIISSGPLKASHEMADLQNPTTGGDDYIDNPKTGGDGPGFFIQDARADTPTQLAESLETNPIPLDVQQMSLTSPDESSGQIKLRVPGLSDGTVTASSSAPELAPRDMNLLIAVCMAFMLALIIRLSRLLTGGKRK